MVKEVRRYNARLENFTLGHTRDPSNKNFTYQNVLKMPIINKFQEQFIVELLAKCRDVVPEAVIVVPSARGNFEKRMDVRFGAQGNYVRLKDHQMAQDRAVMLFFIGNAKGTEKPNITKQVNEEIRLYNDIVIGDFEDHYHNILTKHVLMLRWVTTFCPKAKFVIRTDDDIRNVNISKMVGEMRGYKKRHDNFILGFASGHDVLERDPSNKKYYVSREDYAPDRTPIYVFGASIGYPTSTVELLILAAQRIRKVWLDDIFLTGICREMLEIPVFNCPAFHFQHKLHTTL